MPDNADITGLSHEAEGHLPFERSTQRPHAEVPPSALGRLVLRCWLAGSLPREGLLRGNETLAAASNMSDVTLDAAVALVASHHHALGAHTEQSYQRLALEMGRFVQRLQIQGVDHLADVNAQLARDFVEEASLHGDRWVDPAPSTMNVRRCAIRLLFKGARNLHLASHDPTLDLDIPARASLEARPLTDEEELLGRLVSRDTLTTTRLPAAWALGQATATTGELPALLIRHVDLAKGRVALHGDTRRRVHRWGRLTPWGVEQLTRRIEDLNGDADTPLVYGAQRRGKSGASAAGQAIRQVMIHAGLSGDRSIRPNSLAAWAGRRVFEETGAIEQVALALGVRSLDRAASIIDWGWQE